MSTACAREGDALFVEERNHRVTIDHRGSVEVFAPANGSQRPPCRGDRQHAFDPVIIPANKVNGDQCGVVQPAPPTAPAEHLDDQSACDVRVIQTEAMVPAGTEHQEVAPLLERRARAQRPP